MIKSLFLAIIFTISSPSLLYGQVAKVKSCSEQIVEFQMRSKNGHKGEAAIGFAKSTVNLVVFQLLPASGVQGILLSLGIQLGMGIVETGTKLALAKHRQNILEIFQGAANGGNKRTEKLWKIANRRNRKAFSDISYNQFLNAIHNGDLSGSACEFKVIPKRKDLIHVIINAKELGNDEFFGERSRSEEGSINESGRSIPSDKSTPDYPMPEDLKDGVRGKEF